MTNEEINRYIHTEIMGKCWHDFQCVPSIRTTEYACTICGSDNPGAHNPDYCSDGHPRALLNDVMAIIDSDIAISGAVSGANLPTFRCNAEQLARACVEVHKGEGQWRQRKLRSHEKKF